MSEPNTPQGNFAPYVRHDGTLIISGSTQPHKAGSCAYHFLRKGVQSIDFLCIGANAGQQAMKSMGVFAFKVENQDGFDFSVAFQPIRVSVEVDDRQTKQKVKKDAVCWRAVILDRSVTSQVKLKHDNANDTNREDGT